MIKKLFCFICALFLAACSTSVDGRDRRIGDTGEPTPIPTAVAAARPTYEVDRGEVIYEIVFPGRIAAVVEQALVFSLDGIVSQVYVQRGQRVQAGDPVADLDISTWEAELVLAQSALAIAQAQLDSSQREISLARQRAEMRRDLAQLDLDFALAQAGANPTSEQQYQNDRLTVLLELAQLDVDELDTTVDPELAASVDVAALRVAELENLIAQARLIAPFDGEISALNVSVGRSVATGEPVGAVADPTQIEVTANLRDPQLQELAEELAAQIRPASNPGDALAGSIRRLPYPYGSGGETAVADADQLVRIQFDDMAVALDLYEPGDRVNVSVVVTQRADVLWLPPAAIRDFNGRKFVVVQEGETQQRLDVTLGISGNGRVEILEGVEEGQIIVGQ